MKCLENSSSFLNGTVSKPMLRLVWCLFFSFLFFPLLFCSSWKISQLSMWSLEVPSPASLRKRWCLLLKISKSGQAKIGRYKSACMKCYTAGQYTLFFSRNGTMAWVYMFSYPHNLMAGNIKINYKINYKLNLQLVLGRKLEYDWVKYRLQPSSKKNEEIEWLHKVLCHFLSVTLNIITSQFILVNVGFPNKPMSFCIP